MLAAVLLPCVIFFSYNAAAFAHTKKNIIILMLMYRYERALM
jgi:hypothetical protein